MCLRKKGGNDKHLIGFLCTNKLTTTTEGGKGEKNPKDSGERSQKLRIINYFLFFLFFFFFWVTAFSVLSLAGSRSPPYLPRMPSSTLLISESAVEAAQILIWSYSYVFWLSLVAQRIKCLPTMRTNWVWSLGQEDPLEKEMATHSSTLPWNIPPTEKPGRLQLGRKVSDTTEQLHFHFPCVLSSNVHINQR